VFYGGAGEGEERDGTENQGRAGGAHFRGRGWAEGGGAHGGGRGNEDGIKGLKLPLCVCTQCKEAPEGVGWVVTVTVTVLGSAS